MIIGRVTVGGKRRIKDTGECEHDPVADREDVRASVRLNKAEEYPDTFREVSCDASRPV